MANSDDKFTEPLVARVLDDGPEPVEATRVRIQRLLDDAKARNDTFLMDLYGRKLDELPRYSE